MVRATGAIYQTSHANPSRGSVNVVEPVEVGVEAEVGADMLVAGNLNLSRIAQNVATCHI